jgi:hypothetical protein
MTGAAAAAVATTCELKRRACAGNIDLIRVAVDADLVVDFVGLLIFSAFFFRAIDDLVNKGFWGLPDQYAKLLYQISSPLTPFMISVARQQGFSVAEGARGFVFNAKLEVAIQFLDIGTRPSNLR